MDFGARFELRCSSFVDAIPRSITEAAVEAEAAEAAAVEAVEEG